MLCVYHKFDHFDHAIARYFMFDTTTEVMFKQGLISQMFPAAGLTCRLVQTQRETFAYFQLKERGTVPLNRLQCCRCEYLTHPQRD